MNLIDRYIYAVVKRLPIKQRDDISEELRGLIADMLSKRTGGRAESEEDIEAVLLELGDPCELAEKYSDKPRYLIGPGLYDNYITVLKIAAAAVSFGILLALSIKYAAAPPINIWQAAGEYIGSIFNSVLQAFAWVTAIFAAIEYFGDEKSGRKTKKDWKPEDLPKIPAKEIIIKRSEPIAGLICITILFLIFNYFSIFYFENGVKTVEIFNPVALGGYLILINLSLAVSALKEIMKLVFGKYGVKFAAISIALESISFALIVVVFSDFNIWNKSIIDFLNLNAEAFYDSFMIIPRIILVIIIFSYIADVVSTIVKTVKASGFNIKDINVERFK